MTNYDRIPYFHGVYAVRNRDTGGMYLGATRDVRTRWQAHSWALRAGRHPDPLFQAAWDKHGASAFEIVLMEAIPLTGERYKLEPAMREAERRWLIDLVGRGVELYNRTLPKPTRLAVVEWNPEVMIPG